MADVSKIKLPNGTTYDIKDNVSGYTTNTGTITKVQTTAGAHTTINVSSGAAAFNVPTKTSHLTNDSGFLTSHQTLYEANLNWGGKDFSASYGPVDAAMIDVLGANRFAFLKAAGLTIEYSTNGGSSYTDYGATDAQKVGLFSSGQSFYLGKHSTAGSCTTNDRLRVTINTGAAGIYTVLNKIAIYMSTQGSTVQVLIERALESTPTTFTTHKDWTGISGWSGWNILNISGLTTYGNTAGSQYGRIRFTFRATAVNTTYSAALITKIQGFGGQGWTTPSNMAASGHLYSYDSSQNATFPAKVTANGGFSGALTGNVTGDVTGNVSGTAANVTGVVAIANGGTGQTTAANAINALLNGLPTWTADPTDTTYFVRQDTGGSATYGKVAFSTVWNYISGKLPAWSKASTKPSYTFSEIGSTPTTLSGYGITDAKITSGTITLGSNTITPLTSSSTLNAAKLSGAIPSAVTATTQASTDNSTKIATTAYVTTAIANLPEPMVFKGSVGTGGTVTSLPTAAASNEGWTYKVITALSSPSAKVGDTVISNGSEWIVIPSGDEPSGTVTSVAAANATNGGLTISGSPITSSGTITIGHSNVLNSAQTTQAVYPIKIDKNGHISAYGSAVTIPTVPSATGSATTGISIAAHGTGTVIGVQSTTTTASKVTVGSSSTDYGVKSAGSASTWTFEEKTIPNVTSAGTASSWTFEEKTIPNVTAAGSGSASLTFTIDTTDTKKLKITFSHTHTAPTIGTAIKVQSKSGGSNGTAPTLGTAIKVQSKSGGANSTAPTLGSKVPTVSASDVTVPIKNTSASTFVTGTTHTVTDNGHTHTI